MSAAPKWNRMSVEDYLARELASPTKHEYLASVVYAMTGATNVHNTIAGNAFASLHSRLRGKPCKPCNSDTKIRVRTPAQVRFYYPDASVTCRPNPPTDTFQDEPAVVVEVLSRATRRIDEGEKKDAYLTLPSLDAYLLVEQDAPGVTLYRRTATGFVREEYVGLDAVIPLPEIGANLPLLDIYAGVEFVPEPDDLEIPT